MEKILSVVLSILWGLAVAYVLVVFVSAIVKGFRRLKRRKAVKDDRTGTTGTNSAIAGADCDIAGDCTMGSCSADNTDE